MNFYSKLTDFVHSNKYTKWYNAICMRAQTRARTRSLGNVICGYVESHHILPNFICKEYNIKSTSENLAYLTAREHFIVHLLLSKMLIKSDHINKANLTMLYFCKGSRRTPNRILNNKQYEKARLIYSTHKRTWAKGENNPFYGKSHTEATKNKMRQPRPKHFIDSMIKVGLRRGNSRIYKITNNLTDAIEILFFSEFCRKYGIYQENARKSVKRVNCYKHWSFEQLAITPTAEALEKYMWKSE